MSLNAVSINQLIVSKVSLQLGSIFIEKRAFSVGSIIREISNIVLPISMNKLPMSIRLVVVPVALIQ